MTNEVIFLLDFPGAYGFLESVRIICRVVHEEQQRKLEPTPPKFALGAECATAMLGIQPVSRLAFQGMLDVIGGHYAAVAHANSKLKTASFEEYMEAVDLMKIAKGIEHKAPSEWKLHLVKS